MTETGLTNRLRQRSHRTGVMVGLSMALAIAIFFGGFVWIYAQMDPFLRDFTGAAVTATVTPPSKTPATTASEKTEQTDEATEPVVEEDVTPTPRPQPTPTPDKFTPDYQANSAASVNLRSGPGTNFSIVITLSLAQPLQYLGEDAPTEDPAADGPTWMKFRIEDGQEGWIRQIDADPYQP